MNYENPEINPHPPVPTDEAIKAGAPDFVETPDPDFATPPPADEPLPIWLFIVCGFALFMAGSSFAGFGTFGRGLYDQGPGAPLAMTQTQQTAAVPDDPFLQGKKAYGSYCASCHQAAGVGQPGKYPPLSGSEWVLGSKERLEAIILHGLSGPVQVKGASYGTDQMAPWGTVLDDKHLASVMTYIRGSWDNKADPVTPEEAAAARAKFTSQSAPYGEADLLKIAPNDTSAKK
jgi:mono/diheme cytochrome c family protein